MVDNEFNGYKIRKITPADNASVASIVRYNDYVDVEIKQSLISTANSLNSQTITNGN